MLAPTTQPGVRFERVDGRAPRVAPVRTDVAGFVGLAQRGPLDTPVPVESWRQFESRFGGFGTPALLPFTVRAFFENGGRRCWVVRVASRDDAGGAAPAGVTIPRGLAGGDGWRIAAPSPGTWGNALTISLRETNAAQSASIPAGTVPGAARVVSIDRFARWTLVRVTQEGAAPAYRVVSDVDADTKRLVWVNPDAERRTPYDTPLTGFDLDRPLRIESVEYELVVRERGDVVAVHAGLSSIPEHPRYAPALLAPPAPLRPADLHERIAPAPAAVAIAELRPLPLADLQPLQATSADLALVGGQDGLALLTTADFTGDPMALTATGGEDDAALRGFRALDVVDEVMAIAVPDLHVRPVPPPERAPAPPCPFDPCIPATVPAPVATNALPEAEQPPVLPAGDIVRAQLDLVTHCEARADRIALLDPPVAAALDASEGMAEVSEWRRRFSSGYAVAYWPWIAVVDPERRAPMVPVPPCGHAAGQFARSDLADGVHRAPANVPLAWALDTTLPVDDELHGILNANGVNVVRVLRGRGLRLMGARTLAPEGALRYLNVRRLLIMVRKSLWRATQWATFEPNDWLTRTKLTLGIGAFLLDLWRRGALAGATAGEAFQVRCDEANNPARERDAGHLLAEVAIAPTYPLEFILVRIGRTENELEVLEESAAGGGASWR